MVKDVSAETLLGDNVIIRLEDRGVCIKFDKYSNNFEPIIEFIENTPILKHELSTITDLLKTLGLKIIYKPILTHIRNVRDFSK